MTAVTNQTTLSSVPGLMGDTESQQLKKQIDPASARGLVLLQGGAKQPAPKPDKRAYFWLKAKPKDKAFHSTRADKDRETSISVLKEAGFKVTVFKSNRAFLDHIKQDGSKADLLVISGHGSPRSLEDLVVIGNQIVIADSSLSQKEQEEGFGQIMLVLKDKSIVLLDACLVGNKSDSRNLAKVASKVLRQSKILGSQHCTYYEPWIQYKRDQHDEERIDRIYYGGYDKRKDFITLDPVIYEDGKETSHQKPVPSHWKYTAFDGLAEFYYSPTVRKVGRWALKGGLAIATVVMSYQVYKMQTAPQTD